MPGFLSAYSDTYRHTLDEDGRYWVELKKVLSQGDKEHAERALTNGRMDPGQGVQIDMDTATYRLEMVLASIIAWNLDEEDGTIWPVTLGNVKRLPGIEFDRIFDLINKFNEPVKAAERRDFRPEGERSNSDGDKRGTNSVVAGHVLAGGRNMEATGPQA
jgi:hypothetical protein